MHILAQTHGSYWGIGRVAGALLIGLVLGLIPIALGYALRQVKYGWGGFITVTICGLIGGIRLAGIFVGVSCATIYTTWRRERGKKGGPPFGE